MDQKMFDICMVFSEDGRMWYDYYIDNLKKVVRDLSVYPAVDTKLCVINTSAETLANMASSHVLAIIASPNFLQSLVSHPHISLGEVSVEKSLIFLCGVDNRDFCEVDEEGVRLIDRFPDFDRWKKATDTDWEKLLTMMGELIEAGRRVSSAAAMDHKRKQRKPTPKAKSRKKEFQLLPDKVHCETQTLIFLSFKEVISSSQSETSIEVLISDVDESENDDITVPTNWINPYTVSFLAPDHAPGTVSAKVLIKGKSVGARQFTYNLSIFTDAVLGLTQIHVHQLCTVLDALEKSGDGAVKDRRGSGTGAKAVSEEVDKELSRIFSDSEIDIPLQAFEQIFGSYRFVNSENSTEELPNMLYVSARYGLEELASRLTDLPDAHRAYSVTNRRGLYPENIARENNHQQLAAMFENFREVGDGLQKMYFKYANIRKGKGSKDDLEDDGDEEEEYLAACPKEQGDTDGSDYEDIPSEVICSQLPGRTHAPGADNQGSDMYLALVDESESPQSDGYSARSKLGAVAARQSGSTVGGVLKVPMVVPRRDQSKAAIPPPAGESSEAAKTDSKMSTSQRELISIMEQVKTNRLTQAEADVLFQEWKLKYETGNCASFKQKQKQLALLREEVAAVENQVKPIQSTLKNKLISTLKSSFIGRSGCSDVKLKPMSNMLPLAQTGIRTLARPAGAHLDTDSTEVSRCSTASSSSSSRDSALSSRSSTMSGMMDFEDVAEDSVPQRPGQRFSRDSTIKEKLEELKHTQSAVPPVPPRTVAPVVGSRQVRPMPASRLPTLPEATITAPNRASGGTEREEDTSSDSDNYLSPDPADQEEEEDLYTVGESEEQVRTLPSRPGFKQFSGISMPETDENPHDTSTLPRKGSLPENNRFHKSGSDDDLYIRMDRASQGVSRPGGASTSKVTSSTSRVAPPPLPKTTKQFVANQSGSSAAKNLAEVLQSRQNLSEQPQLKPAKPKQ